MKFLSLLPLLGLLPLLAYGQTKRVAYIHGDVAADGAVPSGDGVEPYDQMLLTDTGATGMSDFRDLVEAEGYQIDQYYDQDTTLDATFLNQFDAIVFGLHQKIWSAAEKTALDTWIRAGGGIVVYSDSAAGGRFNVVGIDNPVGQNVVNNLVSQYGLEVLVDQGGGTRAYQPNFGASSNPIIFDQPIMEGEGVSPVAVDPNATNVEILIPLDPANLVSPNNGPLNFRFTTGISISNPLWAVMAKAEVGSGNVLAFFDRQMFWNNGPGSDIDKEDNKEILRRTIQYLVGDLNEDPRLTVFRTQPGNASAFEGGSVTFTVTGGGIPSPTLQWLKDGVALPGETATTLELETIELADAGVYTLEATNAAGTASTDPATLTVFEPLPPGANDRWSLESGGIVSVEAEDATLPLNTFWDIVSVGSASGGLVLEIGQDENGAQLNQTGGAPDSSEPERIAMYRLRVDETPGDYTLYARTIFPGGSDDSFFWRFDNGAWQQQNGNTSTWITLASGLALDGEHRLEVTYREDGSQLDKFELRTAAAGAPSGSGAAASERIGPVGNWAREQLLPGVSDPAQLAPTGNPDNDRYNNALEFGLALPPDLANGEAVVEIIPDPADPTLVTLRYRRAKLAPGVDVGFQWTDSLTASWNTFDLETDPFSTTSIDDDAEWVEFQLDVGASDAAFGRTEVTVHE